MISCFTPGRFSRRACWRVWPWTSPALWFPRWIAVVKFPSAGTMRRQTSACAAPEIMFLMKSRWPGASMIVQCHLSVKNSFVVHEMVTPRSRSSFWRSMKNANAKEDLPRVGLGLELGHQALVDAAHLEDQAPRGRRLPGVDVPADHDRQVLLALRHGRPPPRARRPPSPSFC